MTASKVYSTLSSHETRLLEAVLKVSHLFQQFPNSPAKKKACMQMPMTDAVQYHLSELKIAKDALDLNHLMPIIEHDQRTILDIGCGIGQTLIAAHLAKDTNAFGIDLDAEAIAFGQAMVPRNIHLTVGRGEALDFPDQMFDLVICRVALPYMAIGQTLREICRVLRPGGKVWMVLHAHSTLRRRAETSFRHLDFKDFVYCTCVWLNSLLFHASGWQIRLKGKGETFQTVAGMGRALSKAGLREVNLIHGHFFVITAARDLRMPVQ